MQARSKSILAVIAAALIFFFLLPVLASLYVDLRWFSSLGYGAAFATPLLTKLALGAVAAGLVFALFYGNLRVALRNLKGERSFMLKGADQKPLTIDVGKGLARVALPLSLLVSAFAALNASGFWRLWLVFLHGQPFGQSDPIFGRDVGFYVFSLPFYDALHAALMFLLLGCLVVSTAFYLVGGAVRMGKPSFRAERPARIHLTVLAALIFVGLAFGAYLSTFHLVIDAGSRVAGAGYTSVHARLPALRILVATAAVGAAMLLYSATRRRLLFVGLPIALYLGVFLIGRALVPSLVQSYSVDPNELEKERDYIAYNIEATRAAYGIEEVAERELSGDLRLSRAEIESNRETIENIRLWDHRPLLDTFGQIQEIRTYYEFGAVDNDRYRIDGQLQQTMLSPRELVADTLPNQTWINEHFTFTHGYGITLGPVNRATAEGLPVLTVQDIPPVSTTERLAVRRPGIYFGERSNDYVFVRTQNREFDHPSGEGNVYTRYEGEAGLPMGGRLLRTALAMDLGSFNILLSEDITAESQVLLHREIRDRMRRLAPFLSFDQDPYMVVRRDGSLTWICDAYTTTSRYPYSAHTEGRSGDLNYIRNSVKVVIDAYDGTVRFYIADEQDPILATWRQIYPTMFRPIAELPRDLREHLRYPLDVFDVQSRVLATYHMDSAELLYNREDQWQVPSIHETGQRNHRIEPYYTVMRLPGEEHAEFILMLPFTPARKDNLAAWLVARNDGEHLGELSVYRFPTDRLVYGPQQVLNRINQDPSISQQLSLWDQRGSQAILGTLLVIPIEESLIYTLPLYLVSEGGRIPQLKRVIVVYQSQIAMAPSLEGAIAEIFGGDGGGDRGEGDEGARAAAEVGEEGAGEGAEPGALGAEGEEEPATARAAMLAFLRAQAAQRRGDWAAYGRELGHLEALLRRMQPAGSEPMPDLAELVGEAPGRASPEGAGPEEVEGGEAHP